MAVVKGSGATTPFKPLTAIFLIAAATLLFSCEIGGDNAEAASTPTVAATSTPTSAPPATTPIPTATPTATPASTLPSPTPTATPSAALPTPTPTATPATTPAAIATPTPTITSERERGSVGRIATARSVDTLQRPVDATDRFAPNERVYVSVEFKGVRSGAVLGVRWKRNGEEVFTFETGPQGAFSRGFFAFYFDPGGGAGSFEAEILVDGEVSGKIGFTVGVGAEG
ncbi:MAG: hypothetical protein OXG11_12485 [Chloroflexi bacterium]|nr:hypothetical protein [Chloroflexota bacterium]